VAQYYFGKAFVVAEASPETAAAVMQKLRERFGETVKAPIAADTFDDAFQVTDKYLGRICIARKGRYLAGYGNLADGQDAVKLAAALAARLP
jgi:hypothetical protein